MPAIDKELSRPAKRARCIPNVLPCRIRHNGPVTASKRYWDPKEEDDESSTAYFRGRKLRGRRVNLPKGYRGVILNKTNRVIKAPAAQPEEPMEDEEMEEEPGQPEATTALDEVTDFDSFTVWGHEALPDEKENPFARGVAEWIKFAEAMHSYDDPPKNADPPANR